MARIKKTSKTLERASIRISGLKSINPTLDLGNGMTVAAYSTKIQETKDLLDAYNTSLSMVDENQNKFLSKEKELKEIHERMLLAVASKYGKDSNEYEKAGGVRKSERKRSTKKAEEKFA
jgi:hypothetical protein